MAKRDTKHRKQKKYTRKTMKHRGRTMKGGAFSEQELQQLENSGFSEQQINNLSDLGVSFNEVMEKVNTIMNNGDGSYIDSDYVTEQVMTELLNEHMLDDIPHGDDDIHELDMGMDESQGTMNLDELDTSNISNTSGYTTGEDISFGGKRRRRISRKKVNKKGRKTRRKRKLKLKGGMCFGNGVGANSYDPNYSIYNTNMLKLFPYKA